MQAIKINELPDAVYGIWPEAEGCFIHYDAVVDILMIKPFRNDPKTEEYPDEDLLLAEENGDEDYE